MNVWNLSSADRAQLELLCNEVRALRVMARSGSDLIAVGEAWDAIDTILAGETAEVNVGLAVGFRRGDDLCSEGLFVGIRVEYNAIVLDELSTTYESGIGSDHSSRPLARLTERGSFDGVGIDEWINALRNMQNDEDARLTTQRDHV